MYKRLFIISLFWRLLKYTKDDTKAIVWVKAKDNMYIPTQNGKWIGIDFNFIKYSINDKTLHVIIKYYTDQTYKLSSFSILYWIVKKLDKSINQFIW